MANVHKVEVAQMILSFWVFGLSNFSLKTLDIDILEVNLLPFILLVFLGLELETFSFDSFKSPWKSMHLKP